MRREGDEWVAYWALPDTMDKEAVWLGEIAIRLVEKEEHRKAL